MWTPRRSLLARCLGLSLGLAAASCATDASEDDGEDGATTGGRRVAISTRVAPGELSFTNDEGWSISVTRALVSVGPLYFFEGEPIEGATDALSLPPPATLPPNLPPTLPAGPPATLPAGPPAGPGLLERVVSPLVGLAHAHPGHYQEGEARGQVLDGSSFDLVAGAAAGPAGEGITGPVRSARFSWGTPPAGPFAAELGSFVIVVEARAEREGEVRFARFEASAADAQNAEGLPQVDGCVFDPVEIAGDGEVTLTIHPGVWLGGADLAELEEGAAGAPLVVPAGTQPHGAFVRGLKKGGAYRFSFAPR